MSALHAEPPASASHANPRQRRLDHDGCCAGCRARVRRRAKPRKQKDPDELSSFAEHVIRLVRRDAAAVAEPSDVVPTLAHLGRVVEDELRATVHDLRNRPDPYTWEAIGDLLGVTKQAAQKRFGGDA